MSTAHRRETISIDEYLAGEQRGTEKHEYVAGVVYAQAGATNAHNLIASNALGLLHAQLRGKPCRVFNSDTKIRIRRASETRFYYPDLSVICHPNPPQDTFQDEPVVIIEVVSESTRRIDEGEKCDAYLSLPSLAAYVLLEQSSPAATVYHRLDKVFDKQHIEGLAGVISLPSIDCRLSLASLYEQL